MRLLFLSLFSFTDASTALFNTLSLHDALPISSPRGRRGSPSSTPRGSSRLVPSAAAPRLHRRRRADRKSTRLNSSHRCISYAVFCLKKKTNSDWVWELDGQRRVSTSTDRVEPR